MTRYIDLPEEDMRTPFECEVDAMREDLEQYLKETGGGVQVQEQQTALPDGTTRQTFTWKKLPFASNVAIDVILETGAQIFCDEAGRPHLRRPRGPLDTREPLAWPIRSWETEAWVSKVYYDHGKRPLTTREFQQAARILEGHALLQTPPLVLGDVLENDLVLALIVSLLSSQPHWEGTATDLLETLRNLATEQQFDLAREPDWPKTAALLSARLTRLTDWMAEAGIGYQIHRTQYQRLHRLTVAGEAEDLRPVGSEAVEEWVRGTGVRSTGVPSTDESGTAVPGIAERGANVPDSSVPGTSAPHTTPAASATPKTPGNDAHDAVFDKVSDQPAAQLPLPRKSLFQQVRETEARARAAEREASRLKAIQEARNLADQELLTGRVLKR